jgi:hypothetical protein
VEACADLGGVAWWSRDCACVDHQLGRPWGRGLAEQRLCRPVQAGGHGLAEIRNVCGSPAWQALSAGLAEIVRVSGVGVWGSTALAGQRSRARGSEIP